MRRSLYAFAFVALAPGAASAVEYVNDPLTASSFPGRGSKGGSFSASGWTTVDEPDAIWYEIDQALPSGRIEYTVVGISTTTSLTGADHDIFTMYQAPTGQVEPIKYNPYFRNNDFKAFTRIFGQQEPGRNGAMKLELAFCPRGEPWHHDYPCTAECEGGAIAYANGTDKDVGWDGTKAYRMAIEWGNGKMSFSRDDVVLGSLSYPSVYAPKPLRVRIGSPRHDGIYPGVAMMPKGLTFRDVLVTGTPGTMTPICGATVPDAGAPDASLPPDAGGGATEHAVLADVTAASWETGVFPDVNDLNVEADASDNPTSVVYLRFPALSGVVEKATLLVRSSPAGEAAGGSGVICAVADDTWNEATMTWATRPAVGTSCAGTTKSIDSDMEVGWDVTSLVKAGANVNLAIVSKDSNGAHFLSKEAGGATKGPRLVVQLASGNAGGGGAGSGGTGWGAGGSSLDASFSGGSGGAVAGGTESDDGGCGCRTANRSRSRVFATLLGALALAFAARRRGRG